MVDPKDILAAERTQLAWLRTGIALMGLGFVVARFGLFLRELTHAGGQIAPPSLDSGPIGVLLVASGVGVNLWASVRHRILVQRLLEGRREVGSWGPVVIGVATGAAGFLLIALLVGALR